MVLIAHTWWRHRTQLGQRPVGPDVDGSRCRSPGSGGGPGFIRGLPLDQRTWWWRSRSSRWSVPALYVGVRRPEVVDVRGLVVHVVVFASRAACYVAIFISVESLIEILSGSTPIVGVLAVIGLLAAVTFHPLQVMLRGVVDELLFGHRPDPLGAADRGGRQHR